MDAADQTDSPISPREPPGLFLGGRGKEVCLIFILLPSCIQLQLPLTSLHYIYYYNERGLMSWGGDEEEEGKRPSIIIRASFLPPISFTTPKHLIIIKI